MVFYMHRICCNHERGLERIKILQVQHKKD